MHSAASAAWPHALAFLSHMHMLCGARRHGNTTARPGSDHGAEKMNASRRELARPHTRAGSVATQVTGATTGDSACITAYLGGEHCLSAV